jgi:hypothetical protein
MESGGVAMPTSSAETERIQTVLDEGNVPEVEEPEEDEENEEEDDEEDEEETDEDSGWSD